MKQRTLAAALLIVLAGIAGSIQAHAASGNADLEVLQVRATGGTAMLDPAFSPNRTDYSVRVNSDIPALQIRTGAWVADSKVTVNGEPSSYLNWYRGPLKPGGNKFDVDVTSTDGTHAKRYVISVQKEDVTALANSFLNFKLNDPSSGLSMPYRLFVPAHLDSFKKYPLVMFLHGGGRNGTDNEQQLHSTEGAIIWAKPSEQSKHPAFVLAPQARPFEGTELNRPLGGFGVTRNAKSERYMDDALKPSADALLAVKVLEKVMKDYPEVDTKRVYITGLSQGGFGTWNIILMRPDLFAAAVPIAGGGDPSLMQRVVNLPIWAFHAADDPVVPVSYSRNSIAALRQLGGTPRYTEYPSGTLFDPYEHFSWVYAYANDEMRDWLFHQARP